MMNLLFCRINLGIRHNRSVASKLCSLIGAAVWFGSCQPTSAQTWSGPTFTEFSGTNHTSDNANMGFYNNDAISYDRRDIIWQSCEPSAGVWDQSRLIAWGDHLLKMRAAGAEVLPVLVYTAPWAADRGARTWIETNWKWEATPRSDGKMDIKKYQKQADGSWLYYSTSIASDLSKFPAANVNHWKNFVTKAVTFLRAAPYNVQYFQIWNEAHPSSGFFQGSLDEYMQKVHLPAASIVRSLGGKVVYGGWPAVTNVNPMVGMLDRNNAWSSLDVLDVHYQNATQLEILRAAAANRGYSSLPIWETEVGFSGNKLFIPDQYTRILYWALSNNWNTPNKFKLFYYAHEAPNDPTNPEYGRNLWSGSNITPQGITLQNLSNQLKGGTLGLLSGVTSTPTLTPQRDTNLGSLEAFTVANRVVIAAHITPTVYGNTTNLALSLPLTRTQITKAERVDQTGTRVDITSALISSGTKTNLSVSIKDASGSQSRSWNDATTGCKVFYVVITKSATTNASTTVSVGSATIN